MTAKRWAILDDAGIVVNVILIDDPVPAGYHPGYGRWLVYQGPAPAPTSVASGIPWLNKTPTLPLQIGDFMNANTGQVFRYVPSQIQQVDPEGNPITVSSAPSVVLKKAGT
jgi:hypothetical protein